MNRWFQKTGTWLKNKEKVLGFPRLYLHRKGKKNSISHIESVETVSPFSVDRRTNPQRLLNKS